MAKMNGIESYNRKIGPCSCEQNADDWGKGCLLPLPKQAENVLTVFLDLDNTLLWRNSQDDFEKTAPIIVDEPKKARWTDDVHMNHLWEVNNMEQFDEKIHPTYFDQFKDDIKSEGLVDIGTIRARSKDKVNPVFPSHECGIKHTLWEQLCKNIQRSCRLPTPDQPEDETDLATLFSEEHLTRLNAPRDDVALWIKKFEEHKKDLSKKRVRTVGDFKNLARKDWQAVKINILASKFRVSPEDRFVQFIHGVYFNALSQPTHVVDYGDFAWRVWERPRLQEFLWELTKLPVEIVLWSAASAQSCHQIIDEIDPNRVVVHRIFSQKKPLKTTGRDMSKSVLIDDSVIHQRDQEENVLICRQFWGHKKAFNHEVDSELFRLLDTIKDLSADVTKGIDVRKRLRKVETGRKHYLDTGEGIAYKVWETICEQELKMQFSRGWLPKP